MPEATESALLPRLVIAAPQGRSGKTTASLGLCAALVARGLRVQPFKKGPDYIDPSWLTEAAGQTCRTLDPFFMDSGDTMRHFFASGAVGSDISLIEGNHGLYDSLDAEGTSSTAAVARTLKAPVILVVNAARMTRSVAAMVRGYQLFEPETNIAAVIFNNVARSRHEAKLRDAVERHCEIPVLGAIPRNDALTIPDRHLGLVPRAENEALIPAIEACRQIAQKYISMDAVISIARTAPPLPVKSKICSNPVEMQARIGVIRDRAFTFYYPANFESLTNAGAELVFIDALRDTTLPNIDALYIGGGFPEMFMDGLSANLGLRRDIQSAIEAGLPVYAECGGLMYLSRRIVWGEKSAEMVGALPCEVELTERPQGHGYVIAQAEPGNPFLPAGTTIRGHEFHNSQVINWVGEHRIGFSLSRGNGLGDAQDGIVCKNVLASYTHLHAAGSPDWAEAMIRRAVLYKEGNR